MNIEAFLAQKTYKEQYQFFEKLIDGIEPWPTYTPEQYASFLNFSTGRMTRLRSSDKLHSSDYKPDNNHDTEYSIFEVYPQTVSYIKTLLQYMMKKPDVNKQRFLENEYHQNIALLNAYKVILDQRSANNDTANQEQPQTMGYTQTMILYKRMTSTMKT